MAWELKLDDLEDLARGAALLGSGGGGDPYVGRLMVEASLVEGAHVTVWDLSEVPDDALVICTAMMGAPTVMVEKIPAGSEGILALRSLEQHLGRRAVATMPMECGGINSTIPLVVAAKAQIPVIDADGMGRAFPELQMETFHVFGVSGTPMAIADERGDVVLLSTPDNYLMEWLARGITIRMGGASLIAEYPMDGATAKKVSIGGTLSLGIALGRAIRSARERHSDLLRGLAEVLRPSGYGEPRLIFQGKILDVLRHTTGGFARGHSTIAPFGQGPEMRVRFQNEYLIAEIDDRVAAVVPDLICILDEETGEPITTEGLRYGQRVHVITIRAPAIMRSREALVVFGPQAFQLDCEYSDVVAPDASGR
jgi:DUF917 family protein